MKKILKLVLMFVIVFVLTYFTFTIRDFFLWCDEIGVNPLQSSWKMPEDIDIETINRRGEEFEKTLEALEEMEKQMQSEYPETETIYDYFNPLGYVIFVDLHRSLHSLVTNNIRIAMFLSISITIAYIIISNKKMNNMLKFIVGYLSSLIIIPPLYMYSYTDRFWSLKEMYLGGTPKQFYIVYTLLFVAVFAINYIVKAQIAKKLNNVINNK